MALARGERILSVFGAELDERRSERLWYEIEFIVRESGFELNEIDLFSVCTGPGSFTGLRIGIAAVKGLAMAEGRPATAVTSLEALAFSARATGPVLALVNAQKGEFYAQLFECEESALPQARGEPSLNTAIDIACVASQIERLTLVGEGAEAVFDIARETGPNGAIDSWAIKTLPQFLAEHVARAGYLKYARGEALAAGELKANYVRPSDAEVKLSLGLVGKGPVHREKEQTIVIE
jgi:tRNA threonylcarbamoyladenosine biosynthesis protein TsaB